MAALKTVSSHLLFADALSVFPLLVCKCWAVDPRDGSQESSWCRAHHRFVTHYWGYWFCASGTKQQHLKRLPWVFSMIAIVVLWTGALFLSSAEFVPPKVGGITQISFGSACRKRQTGWWWLAWHSLSVQIHTCDLECFKGLSLLLTLPRWSIWNMQMVLCNFAQWPWMPEILNWPLILPLHSL